MINLAFRVNINNRFEHEATGVDKSYEYSCSCQESKSNCVCPEATLEVSLKVRYQLSDPLRDSPNQGDTES